MYSLLVCVYLHFRWDWCQNTPILRITLSEVSTFKIHRYTLTTFSCTNRVYSNDFISLSLSLSLSLCVCVCVSPKSPVQWPSSSTSPGALRITPLLRRHCWNSEGQLIDSGSPSNMTIVFVPPNMKIIPILILRRTISYLFYESH